MAQLTPAEHIASLKQGRPISQLTAGAASHALKNRSDVGSLDVERLVLELNQTDYAERLLETLRPRLPDDICALLDNGCIAVGELEEPTVNAYTVALSSGHAIVLHSATHRFIYRIARVLATRFVIRDAPEEQLRFEETVSLMAEVFWWYQETGSAFGPEYSINGDQLEFANRITIKAMAFLLGHELAHAVIDQTAGADWANETAAAPHLDEHGADVLGALIVLNSGPQGPRAQHEMALAYAGVEFALQIYHTLEQLGFSFSESHPRAAVRLAIIRLTIKGRCSDDASWQALTELSGAIDTLFSRIAETILNPADHENFFARQAEQLVAELNEAMESCGNRQIPDYVSFYQVAAEVFSRGYSHRLLARTADIAAEFFKLMDDPASFNPRERRLRHQKFKLLVGFIDQHMAEPGRMLFRSALGLGATTATTWGDEQCIDR